MMFKKNGYLESNDPIELRTLAFNVVMDIILCCAQHFSFGDSKKKNTAADGTII
ncbi:MAG: hypothetical protein ABJA57_05385 [Ginsengibacter sp.]